ncbi:Fic family protein [Patescibacteria group bacterium]|nr:Fic family protein [Patescibacteria group bacterium]MBU1016016.1 Fic family protein [Patescibacteria group bacterium]MBU1684641.1 Fic family protein [Patescibacteria group bacterium]MBU1939081.1 Fic family protein [Patescibacteria group bacterium]
MIQAEIYQLLEEKLKKLNKFRPISSTMLLKLKERFEIEMIYNSNAIEGNTLTLKETYWVIQQGLTVKGKPLKDHLEARNHQEALDYLYELVEHGIAHTISEHLIRELHALVIQDIDKEIAGRYRDTDVFITGTEHVPPSALEVPNQMRLLIDWARANHRKLDVVEFAAIFHHKFVHIHPFKDGNGRVGRLLMNIFLIQYGFPLTIIQKNDRQKYYRVLASADRDNYKPLVQFISQAILRSLNIYLDVLTPSKQKEGFISLAAATKYCSYSQAYLGKLAKEGKLEAIKIKRNWITTKEAVLKYVKKHKRK